MRMIVVDGSGALLKTCTIPDNAHALMQIPAGAAGYYIDTSAGLIDSTCAITSAAAVDRDGTSWPLTLVTETE